MKKFKLICKRIIILYLILYILLFSTSTCLARGYDAACGEYVSQYARDFIAEYCTPETKTEYVQISEPNWTGGEMGKGIFQCCCSTGVKYMYELALGINLYTLDFHPVCDEALKLMPTSSNWIEITSESELQAGDVLLKTGHTELYVGNGQRANFGNSPYSGVIRTSASLVSAGGKFTKAYRLRNTVDVDPSGKVRGGSTSNVNYSKFFFNGVPDGQYSLAKRTFWQVIIDTIGQILDFIVNLVLYIIRAVFVGFTAIAESLLSWMINVVSDTNVEDKSLDMSATETSTSDEETKITVDKIFFNKLEIFDINIFDVD